MTKFEYHVSYTWNLTNGQRGYGDLVVALANPISRASIEEIRGQVDVHQRKQNRISADKPVILCITPLPNVDVPT